jgi:hypothetical protein
MKILKSVLLIFVLSAAVFSQQNSFSSIVRNTFSQSSPWVPQAVVMTSHTFKDSAWSFANYVILSNSWGETFFGPRYSHSDVFCATLYAGPETKNWWRLAADVTLSWKKFSWYNYYENGKTPYCWLSIFSLSLTKSLKGKVKSYVTDKGIRVGPGFSWSIPKTPVSITPTALYNSADRHLSLQLDICSSF